MSSSRDTCHLPSRVPSAIFARDDDYLHSPSSVIALPPLQLHFDSEIEREKEKKIEGERQGGEEGRADESARNSLQSKKSPSFDAPHRK